MDRQVHHSLDGRVPALLAAVDAVEDAEQELDVRVRAGLGLNAVDFAVLRWVDRVRRRGGSTRVGDITDHFGVSSGSATEIVHRLTRAGLLQRHPHPTDARVRTLVPTDRAHERLGQLVGPVRAELDALLATVTAQEEQRLLGLLAAVCEILRAERTDGADAGGRGRRGGRVERNGRIDEVERVDRPERAAVGR